MSAGSLLRHACCVAAVISKDPHECFCNARRRTKLDAEIAAIALPVRLVVRSAVSVHACQSPKRAAPPERLTPCMQTLATLAADPLASLVDTAWLGRLGESSLVLAMQVHEATGRACGGIRRHLILAYQSTRHRAAGRRGRGNEYLQQHHEVTTTCLPLTPAASPAIVFD